MNAHGYPADGAGAGAGVTTWRLRIELGWHADRSREIRMPSVSLTRWPDGIPRTELNRWDPIIDWYTTDPLTLVERKCRWLAETGGGRTEFRIRTARATAPDGTVVEPMNTDLRELAARLNASEDARFGLVRA